MKIFSAQIRAARGLSQMSQVELAANAGISLQTIKNLEKDDKLLSKASSITIEKIKEALENKGVRFTISKEDGKISEVGVKLAITLVGK